MLMIDALTYVHPIRVGNVRETFASGILPLKVQIKKNNYEVL